MFFPGLHQPSDAKHFPRAFVSVNRLLTRVSDFQVNEWIMDCAGFTEVSTHGGYRDPVRVYAARIKRWSTCGKLLAAVSQDYMCESFMLARTGLSISDHQRLTIERYDELLTCDVGGIYIMPVLQGFAPPDYVSHVRQYGARLVQGAWVGVGSVCKRNASPTSVEAVLLAIHRERPDLRLHGFGLKTTALQSALVRDLLHSADSMAWSFAARKQGRSANDWREAERFASNIETLPLQLGFADLHFEAAA